MPASRLPSAWKAPLLIVCMLSAMLFAKLAQHQNFEVAEADPVETTGSVARGDFIRMTGLEERTARKVVSRFLADGLLKSDGHRSELSIGFPMSSLNILFPNLYPEAATAALE